MEIARGTFLFLTLASVAFVAPGCTTTTEDQTPRDPGPPPGAHAARWTTMFLEPAFLVADEIVIEGPAGLREHLAVRQESPVTTYTAKTTPKGFLQESAARADAGYVEIRAALDAWTLVAFRRIVWLERPGDAPVLVRASGRATFKRGDGTEEREGETLEFHGELTP